MEGINITKYHQESINFKFNMHYDTGFGKAVYMIGNISELGNWNIKNAYRLHYQNNNNWTGELIIKRSETI